ncbi:hypothetical protein YC2023_058537 [Brassica napus]
MTSPEIVTTYYQGQIYSSKDAIGTVIKDLGLNGSMFWTAGIETEVSSGTILGRTTSMTANVLARTQFAVLIIDVRAGLHPLDLEVGKWLSKHAPQIKPIVVMNKSESIGESLAEVASEALALGFGEPTAISAETGLGMTALYEIIKSQRSMTHSEVVIARRAVEEGRGLVVIVNKMDCLRGKQNSEMYKKIKEVVPIEVQAVIP